MNIIATTRNVQGTGASRRLRRADKLPGIVYGGNLPATPIEIEHNPIFYALRKEKFHASILTMELDGKEELVVLRAFQMHPYKPQVMHIDFQRINPNEKVTMRVPLHFQGEEESPAVKVAAIEVTCMPKELPEFITVDLSKLEAGQTFHASMLQLPEGIEVHAKSGEDIVLATVALPVEEEVPSAEGEAAETPAA